MREITRLHGLILNWRTVVAGLVLVILSLILLWASEKLAPVSPLWWGKVLPAFGAVVGTSGVFAMVYELLVRRQQTRYVLESLDLREALLRTGLDDVSTNYMDYDYAAQITRASEIVVFVLYAQTWITRYAVELAKHLEENGKSLILCTPSYGNPFLPPLAQQFGYELKELKRKIAESIATVVQPALAGRLGTDSFVRVVCHKSRPSYSLYKFDDRLLVGTYYASSARRRAPMFEFMDVPGSMYEEFAADLDQVMNVEGEVIFDSKAGVNRIQEALGEFIPASLEKKIAEA
jgi:hypothetical protein